MTTVKPICMGKSKLKMVKLNQDMISYSGDIVEVP
jgi:hypothetical protein